MKKTLSILLTLALAGSVLAGCAAKDTDTKAPAATPEPTSTSKPADNTGIVKMGMAAITSIAKSKDLGTDKDGKEVLPTGQVDTVIVAAAFDKDGKVLKVTIDNAQTKVDFNKDLTVKSDLKAPGKTKVELGDNYGMKKASKIQKEWHEQIAALENWMIGKTVAEIKGMKVKQVDATHPSVPDVAELTSSVTITVQDYIAGLEKAFKNAVNVQAGAVKLGLGHGISIGKSKGFEVKDGKEVLPVAQVDTVMVAAVFDKDGKVMGALIDNAQTKVEYSKEGKVTSDKNAALKTKVEAGDAYGMKKASKIQKEWYQQIAELQKWMVGKTVAEVTGMKVKQVDAAHPSVPDVAELTSHVTITIQDYLAGLEEASKNAK
jgi:uncharacterized protein YuzE